MNSYNILKNIHKVGHLISGVVLGYEKYDDFGLVLHRIRLQTYSEFKCIATFYETEKEKLSEKQIPQIGSIINAVIKNHVDDTLYVSINSSDLQKVEEYQRFYEFINNHKEGEILLGTVKKVVPFGIFIDLGYPYIGLIDGGHCDNFKKLPQNFVEKIHEGDKIKCVIEYFRFKNKQIGLSYLQGL